MDALLNHDLSDEEADHNLTIAFCGIFSSGKSSLLNELLNQEVKLPTGIEPVTKFVTRVEYGVSFKAYYIENGQKRSVDPAQIKQIVRGEKSLPESCDEIVLQMPADILKSNIVILDTPGYEDDPGLTKATRKAVQKADLAVFCCHADHFGCMFEKEYFQELEDSLGNYCVVINHSDLIYTDRDFDKLKESVREEIRGRGERVLKKYVKKTLFFTTAVGKYKDLDGLDVFFRELENAKGDGWKRLKSYADRKKVFYRLGRMRTEAAEYVEEGMAIYKELEHNLSASYDHAFYQYQVECHEVEKALVSLRNFIYDSLNRKTSAVQEQIEELEKEGKHQDFVESVKKIMNENYMTLPADIVMWKKKQPTLKGKGIAAFSSDLTVGLQSYQVPEPKGQLVKNRGLFGTILVSAVVSVISRGLYLDDGYDVEYHGYAVKAVQSIKLEFVPKLKGMIDAFLQIERIESMPAAPFMDTSVLAALATRIHEWTRIRGKMDAVLAQLQLAFDPSPNRDVPI